MSNLKRLYDILHIAANKKSFCLALYMLLIKETSTGTSPSSSANFDNNIGDKIVSQSRIAKPCLLS